MDSSLIYFLFLTWKPKAKGEKRGGKLHRQEALSTYIELKVDQLGRRKEYLPLSSCHFVFVIIYLMPFFWWTILQAPQDVVGNCRLKFICTSLVLTVTLGTITSFPCISVVSSVNFEARLCNLECSFKLLTFYILFSKSKIRK